MNCNNCSTAAKHKNDVPKPLKNILKNKKSCPKIRKPSSH